MGATDARERRAVDGSDADNIGLWSRFSGRID
jgi:hypothetical protein